MYTDKKRKTGLRVLLGLLALAIVLGLAVWAVRAQSRDLRDEGARAIQEAIQRSALQCYVVEGVYPPNLVYLEEHYGLSVNTRDYYVTYEAFASNQPPTVRVVEKPEN